MQMIIIKTSNFSFLNYLFKYSVFLVLFCFYKLNNKVCIFLKLSLKNNKL